MVKYLFFDKDLAVNNEDNSSDVFDNLSNYIDDEFKEKIRNLRDGKYKLYLYMFY